MMSAPRTWPAVTGTAVMLAGVSMSVATVALAIADRHSLPFWRFQLAGLSIEQTYALRVASATLGLLVSSIVAGLVLWRQPRNAFSWAFATMALGLTSNSLMGQYAVHGLNVAPGSVLFADLVARAAAILTNPTIIAVLVAFLLFPDGRLKSKRWAMVVALAVIATVSGTINDLGQSGGVAVSGFFVRQFVPITSPPEIWPISAAWRPIANVPIFDFPLQLWVETALAVLMALAVLLRLRQARGETRQQLKWFTYAVTLGAFAFIPTRLLWLDIFSAIPRPVVEAVVSWADFVGLGLAFGLLIPLAVGVAIFRYRLYAIDLVISRTIVYAGLAAFVTAIYALTVAGVGGLIGEQAGRDPLLTVLAIAIVALLLEPVRSRLQRIANIAVYGKRANPYEVLSDFARSVGRAESADDLVPRMARLLRDGTGAASVQLWVKVGERLHLAASDPSTDEGQRTALDTKELASRAGVTATVLPVFHEAEVLGAFVVLKPRGERMNAIESRLLEDLASQAGLVFSRFRLLQELRESRSRIVAAQDLERRRLERDLHDGAQQRFASALLALGMARESKNGASDSSSLIEEASMEVRAGLSELRDLARGLHPPLLTEAGLRAAVSSLADRSPIMTSVHASDRRYREPIEVTAYYVIAEALANAAKHSRASNVDVNIGERDGRLRIEVRDDGVGGVDLGRGSGLVGLRDRLAASGGTLAVESTVGRGTVVRAELPCA
jgi:signal transduction histidine kinase